MRHNLAFRNVPVDVFLLVSKHESGCCPSKMFMAIFSPWERKLILRSVLSNGFHSKRYNTETWSQFRHAFLILEIKRIALLSWIVKYCSERLSDIKQKVTWID